MFAERTFIAYAKGSNCLLVRRFNGHPSILPTLGHYPGHQPRLVRLDQPGLRPRLAMRSITTRNAAPPPAWHAAEPPAKLAIESWERIEQ